MHSQALLLKSVTPTSRALEQRHVQKPVRTITEIAYDRNLMTGLYSSMIFTSSIF